MWAFLRLAGEGPPWPPGHGGCPLHRTGDHLATPSRNAARPDRIRGTALTKELHPPWRICTHPEACSNGRDDDCDDEIDCDDPDCVGAGWGEQDCWDGRDGDCDGAVDCEDVDCRGHSDECPAECNDGACSPGEDCGTCPDDCGSCPVCGDDLCEQGKGESCVNCSEDCDAATGWPEDHPEACSNEMDEDCDGAVDCADEDCQQRAEQEGWREWDCWNGRDDDCDGLVDCGDPECIGQNLDCPADCGDQICDRGAGEGCATCPDDCGDCDTESPLGGTCDEAADCAIPDASGTCDSPEACVYPEAFCFVNEDVPNGYCTILGCATRTDPCPDGSACIQGDDSGDSPSLCLALCNDGSECREGWRCEDMEDDLGDPITACIPEESQGGHCGDGDCDPAIGEDCESCEQDCCGPGPGPGDECGDGQCGPGEGCEECPDDCCEPGPGGGCGQDGPGFFKSPVGHWDRCSAQAYALLVLERSIGGACLDTYDDGVCDFEDNCPTVANANGQEDDADDDGVGDACDQCPGGNDDEDADGDGVCDLYDVCPGGDDEQDADGDGMPDGCDVCPGGDDGQDADDDGLPDDCDECPDTPAGDDPDPARPGCPHNQPVPIGNVVRAVVVDLLVIAAHPAPPRSGSSTPCSQAPSPCSPHRRHAAVVELRQPGVGLRAVEFSYAQVRVGLARSTAAPRPTVS